MRSLIVVISCAALLAVACRSHEVSSSDAASDAIAASSEISDASIGRAFDDVRAFDPVLRNSRVHAAVVHGDVTLMGTASTVSARNRAEELVGILKGARSLVDEIVVNAPRRSDADIVTDVKASIHGDPATRSANVEITSDAQLITLRGDVDSPTQRELLADLASRVSGVRGVNVAVQIRGAPSASEIAADIDARFRADARVDGPRIGVVVEGRAVVLSGVVGSLLQRTVVMADAWVPGVASIDAHALRVDWSEWLHGRDAVGGKKTTDASLATAITRALADDVRVGVPVPTVNVDHGVVTLSGTVMDFRAARVAVRVANRVRGVQSIQDRLTVQPAKQEDDATIQKQVEQSVFNDIADVRSIQITTMHAKVTIVGRVASEEEKVLIEDDVAEVAGVVAIEDDVQVVGYGPATHAVAASTIRSRAVENVFADARIPSDSVEVSVAANGDATLTGLVDDGSEARAASDDAVRAGAAHVINSIRVKP